MTLNTVGTFAIPEAGITDAEYVVILTGTKEEIQEVGKLLMQPVEVRAAKSATSAKPKPDPIILKWAGETSEMDLGSAKVLADVTETRGGRWRWDIQWTTTETIFEGYDDTETVSAVKVVDGGWAATEELAKAAANRWAGRKLGLV